MMQLDIWGNPSIVVIKDMIATQTYFNSKLLRYEDSLGTYWESSWGPFPDLEYKCIYIGFEYNSDILEGNICRYVKGRTLTFDLDSSKIILNSITKNLTESIDREIIKMLKKMA